MQNPRDQRAGDPRPPHEAKKLLADGADVKATDQYSHTAQHSTVFGSSHNTKPSIIVSYEELADQLLQKGVDINHEDIYNPSTPVLQTRPTPTGQ
jgi:ankyrin repeat protein